MESVKEFEVAAMQIAKWLSTYFTDIEHYRVVPQVEPGDIENKFEAKAPQKSTDFANIFNDFKKDILPGITHWQHPGFHAYFPANNSLPSVLAEFLMAGLGIQGMKWLTSPAATELEKVVMKWLSGMLKLPAQFEGVITDTASVSTLCAVVAARELKTAYKANDEGIGTYILRYYCSVEAHSSVEKAVRIAGIGSKNLVKIDCNEDLTIAVDKLEQAIQSDIKKGYIPACLVGALGTTGTGAIDNIEQLGEISRKYKLWFHIDAAYSGSALILPEFRNKIKGLELADSFVFNPHKWMMVNFDCSAFYVKDKTQLTKAFSLIPGYLQSEQDSSLDYSNWTIQLGRRFRALKLWMHIKSFGTEALAQKIRHHIQLGEYFENLILNNKQLMMPLSRNLNVVCFRLKAKDGNIQQQNAMNEALLKAINSDGRVFLSHTYIKNYFTIRFVCGQSNVKKKHIDLAYNIISAAAKKIKPVLPE